jgi:hypothetical protein
LEDLADIVAGMLPSAIRNLSAEELGEVPIWSNRVAGLYCDLRDSGKDALAITLREVKKILRRCQLLSGRGIAALPAVVTQFLTDRSAGDDKQQQTELQQMITEVLESNLLARVRLISVLYVARSFC